MMADSKLVELTEVELLEVKRMAATGEEHFATPFVVRLVDEVLAGRAALAEAETDAARLDALEAAFLSMTDGNEWFCVTGEPGTDSGRTYRTDELRALADALLAQAGEQVTQ